MNMDKRFRSSSQPIRTSLKNDAIIFTANHIKLLQNYWVTLTFLPSVMTALASCGTSPRQYSSFTSPMPSRCHLAHHSSRFSLWQTFHLEEYFTLADFPSRRILLSPVCRSDQPTQRSQCTNSIFVRPASIPHPVHVSAFPQPLWITPTASTVLLSLPLVYPLPMQLADSPTISVPCASVTFHGNTRDLTT